MINLEYVAVQLGLPIDGEPITDVSSSDLVSLCDNLFDVVPPETVYKGNSIKLSWLNSEFQDLPDDADDVMVAQHAWAHILTLIRSLLMLDTSGSRVHLMYLLLLSDLHNVSNYSWGQVFWHAFIVLLTIESILIKRISVDARYFCNVGHGTASHAFLLHFSHLVMLMLLMGLVFH